MKPNNFDITQHSELVGLIYESAYAPERWPELMQGLDDYVLLSSIEEKTQGSLLEPHFIRAVKIDQKISALQSRNTLFDKILNQLPLGIIITNGDAKVMAMNERAKTLPNLTVINGTLQTHSHKKTETLQQLILSCAHGVLEPHKNTFFIAGENESQRASIWVAQTELLTDTPESHNEKCVALYISSPMIHPEYDAEVIRHEFKLTLAEAQLVKVMINGCHNLNDAAKTLGVSVHTVRTQIKVIFEKTHTHSQIELIKKVLTHPTVLFGETQKTHRQQTSTPPPTPQIKSSCPTDGF